jgi:hypothetical protein
MYFPEDLEDIPFTLFQNGLSRKATTYPRLTKLDKLLAKNQHSYRKLLYFVNRRIAELSKSAKI